MSDQVWTVVLVLLGAVLATGTQVISEFFRHRNEDRRQTRAVRREAYSDFLMEMQAGRRSIGPLAAVRLVAPSDTWLAADALWTAIAKAMDEDDDAAEVAAAIQPFMECAQRDLGIPITR